MPWIGAIDENGKQCVLNSDYIVRFKESEKGTAVLMTDGKWFPISDNIAELVQAVLKAEQKKEKQ